MTVLVVVNIGISRPGRTDSSGGHTDRKTGRYHKHNSGQSKLTSINTDKPLAEPKLSTPNSSTQDSTFDPTNAKLDIPRKRYVVYARDSPG